VITLPELANFPDFLVERTRYEAAIERNWTLRDKCKVWWRGDGEEGGTWWEGRVSGIKPKSPDFPDSPWEKYVIQYKNDGSEQSHSPWELHDVGNLWVPWNHPHIDIGIRNELLSKLENLQEISHANQVNLIYNHILHLFFCFVFNSILQAFFMIFSRIGMVS
jgi:hypothetical protein